MHRKKQTYIAVLLALIFLLLSTISPLAADTQVAYSKIPDDLLAAFNEIGSNETLNILVWLEDNSTDEYQEIVSSIPEPSFENFDSDTAIANNPQSSVHENKTNEEQRAEQMANMQNFITQKRQIAQAVYLEDNSAIAAELAGSGADIVYISRYSALIICDSTLSEAIDIAKKDCVTALEYSYEIDTTHMDVSSVSTGLSSTNIPNGYASGVKIGVLEIELPDLTSSVFADITAENKVTCFDPGIDYSIYSDESRQRNTTHATYVTAILTNSEYGTARDFEHLYSAAGNSTATKIESIEWMLSNGVNVINNSTGVDYSPTSYENNDIYNNSQTGYFTKWLDHIAYNHSVHYIASSGNNSSILISLTAMAYNVISVGNVDDINTTTRSDDIIHNKSSYNSVANAEYALKPDICAPGVRIDIPNTNGFFYTDADGITHNMEESSGTSFSAPHVAGIVAVLCSYKPTLLTKQALVKSILLSSVSKNTAHRYDTSNVMGITTGYRRYGSGIVNARNAQILIDSGNYINSSIAANKTSVTHSLGTIQAGETVSVTLCFLKRVRFTSAGHESGDPISESDMPIMTIHIRGASTPIQNTHQMSNETNNNNVQKLIFTASETDEYNLIINKTGGSETYETIYAVSWLKDSNNLQ